MYIATVGKLKTPVTIKEFGIDKYGTPYAVCNFDTSDIDVPVMLELINIEPINDCK